MVTTPMIIEVFLFICVRNLFRSGYLTARISGPALLGPTACACYVAMLRVLISVGVVCAFFTHMVGVGWVQIWDTFWRATYQFHPAAITKANRPADSMSLLYQIYIVRMITSAPIPASINGPTL